jgi:hypothetical protein
MVTAVMNRWRAVQAPSQVVAMLLVGGLLTACDEGNGFPTTCDRPESDEPTPYHGGTIHNGVYATSDWYGELLHFPGGAYYKIYHDLYVGPPEQTDQVPDWFVFYTSFERDGLASGSLAQAGGNQVEVKALDHESITIVNGTCAEFWLLGRVGEQD